MLEFQISNVGIKLYHACCNVSRNAHVKLALYNFFLENIEISQLEIQSG